MEYAIMFVTHLIKTAHYFLVEGIPTVPVEQIPEAIEALFWQSLKIAEIYATLIAF